MKLNTRDFRYLSQEDWRVLAAVEQGSRNHEVVPTPIIANFSRLQNGSSGVSKCISTLAKANLIAKVKNTKYDGYRLTYGGLDYLALHSHVRSKAIVHLGSQMGVGKESDIYLVTTPAGTGLDGEPKAEQAILKLHRLGRTSFRSLKNTRTYHKGRQHCTWQHLSCLSAQKEYAAMSALYRAKFPVPRPINWNRHAVAMSLVPGTPLRAVPLSAFGSADTEDLRVVRDKRIAALYSDCMELALRFAEVGVIHGDFNEFNILIEGVPDDNADEAKGQSSEQKEAMKPWAIDFPQITSLSHPQASTYFQRDVDCIKLFFDKRFHFVSDESGPTFEEAMTRLRKSKPHERIDVEIEAAGFSKKMAKDLDGYYNDSREIHEEEENEDKGESGEDGADDEQQQASAEDQTGDIDAQHTNSQDTRGDWQELVLDQETLRQALEGEQDEIDANASSGDRLTVEALQSLDIGPDSKPRPHKQSTVKSKKAAGWAI